MAETPQEVLREAAEYISEHGWAQGKFYDGEKACAIGAISIVLGEDNRFGKMAKAQDLLSAHLGTGLITNWNDAPERTAEDVILAMKKAAEDA